MRTGCLQDHKMKHMADLQQSVVSDVDTKQQINNQIIQWEENLERLHCEQFRLRCYMASLQSGELPNPKVSINYKTQNTKTDYTIEKQSHICANIIISIKKIIFLIFRYFSPIFF